MHCKICILYDLQRICQEREKFLYQHNSIPKEEDLFLGPVYFIWSRCKNAGLEFEWSEFSSVLGDMNKSAVLCSDFW